MVKNRPSTVVERHRAKGIKYTCKNKNETQADLYLDGTATSHGNQHWMVPRSVNNLFTGRAELLKQIQKALYIDHASPADGQKRFVITGMGGQGKSEISLKVANLMREE